MTGSQSGAAAGTSCSCPSSVAKLVFRNMQHRNAMYLFVRKREA